MALCAALAVVLRARTGAEDLVLGFPAIPAGHPPVVGVFNNSVALRLELAGTAAYAATLDHVAERVIEAYEHARLPFDIVLEQAGVQPRPGRGALFDIGVSWEPAVSPAEGMTAPFDPVVLGVRANCDLWIYARERDSGLTIELVYDQGLASSAEAADLMEQFLASLQATGSERALPEPAAFPPPAAGAAARGERRYDL
jgi:non-ribosomal peptide synthetase component F